MLTGYFKRLLHRVNTTRGEKGGGGGRFVCQIEPNFPLPHCTVVEGCQAGGLGHLLQYVREYNAESPNHGSKRFNLNKDEALCPSGYD